MTSSVSRVGCMPLLDAASSAGTHLSSSRRLARNLAVRDFDFTPRSILHPGRVFPPRSDGACLILNFQRGLILPDEIDFTPTCAVKDFPVLDCALPGGA